MGEAFGPHPSDHGVRPLSDAASPARRAAQAVDALRHGWPLVFNDGENGAVTLLPVETAIAREATAPRMLISAARAATLKLVNQREAAVPHAPVLIRGGEAFDMAQALPIADPALDLGNPFKGPFKAETIEWDDIARAAMELARIAGNLPAFLVNP